MNDKSDEFLTKQFYTEFCDIIKEQLEKQGNVQGEAANGQVDRQIYLIDVMEKLHFISADQLRKNSGKLRALLKI